MATYLDELVQKITTKANLKGFDDLDRKQKRAIKSNDLLAKSFRRAFGIFFGIQGIRSVIQTTRDLDLLQKSIKGLTGSVQDWQFLRQEAYRTGTSLKTIARAYKNFYSAARGSGFNGNQIQGMFSGLLTAGRGIGANQQQIGGALVALEQMLSKGKVSAEELRKQLGNALPGAVEIAQRAMGVTGAQFEEMMKKGISAAEFVPKFIAQAEKELGKGFKENIKSLDFALVNLNTAWMEFQANILRGEAGEALAQLVRDVTKILRSQTLLRFVQMIGKALTVIIKHLRLILTLFGVKVIFNIIRAVKALHWAILDVATSTGAASAATQVLAMSYAMITSGSVLAGLKLLTKALWAMAVPLLRLGGILAGLVSWFMILQDLWLTFTDKDADTITRRMMNIGKTNKDLKNKSSLRPLTLQEKDKMNEAAILEGRKIESEQDKNGQYIFKGSRDIGIPTISGSSGNNFSGNYNNSDSKKVSNSFTINISAPNSQSETIAQATEEVLQKFFTKYEMGFA